MRVKGLGTRHFTRAYRGRASARERGAEHHGAEAGTDARLGEEIELDLVDAHDLARWHGEWEVRAGRGLRERGRAGERAQQLQEQRARERDRAAERERAAVYMYVK